MQTIICRPYNAGGAEGLTDRSALNSGVIFIILLLPSGSHQSRLA